MKLAGCSFLRFNFTTLHLIVDKSLFEEGYSSKQLRRESGFECEFV